MDNVLLTSCISAISIGFIHILLSPAHYLPIVAIGKSHSWSEKKVLFFTFLCSLGHSLTSVAIGIVGIVLGIVLVELEEFQHMQKRLALIFIVSLGALYLMWALYKLFVKKEDCACSHGHDYSRSFNMKKDRGIVLAMFTAFLLSPCHLLIPVLIYPAAHSISDALIVSAAYVLATVVSMLVSVFVLLKGVSVVKFKSAEKYAHIITSLIIISSGIILFGLENHAH